MPSVISSHSGNCPANVLVTEQPQYSVAICIFSTWQNTETMLISNGLRLIFFYLLFLAQHITFHLARHTYATTICLMNGVSLETLSKMLGHKRITTTQTYAKVTQPMIDREVEMLKIKLADKFMAV